MTVAWRYKCKWTLIKSKFPYTFLFYLDVVVGVSSNGINVSEENVGGRNMVLQVSLCDVLADLLPSLQAPLDLGPLAGPPGIDGPLHHSATAATGHTQHQKWPFYRCPSRRALRHHVQVPKSLTWTWWARLANHILPTAEVTTYSRLNHRVRLPKYYVTEY